jgi:hypothetical protein
LRAFSDLRSQAAETFKCHLLERLGLHLVHRSRGDVALSWMEIENPLFSSFRNLPEEAKLNGNPADVHDY